MRFFITIPSMNVAGGIERVVSIQVEYWVKKCNHDVYIITYANKQENSYFQLPKEVKIIDISKPDYLNSVFNPIKRIKSATYYKKAYKSIINKYKPDIIFSMMHGNDVLILPSVCNNIPIVAVNHISLALRKGDFAQGLNKLICKIQYSLLLKKLKKYNAVIALSRTEELLLKKINKNSIYIPNPLRITADFIEVPRKKQIICVGRLDYLKGQDRLIDIWGRISYKYSDWTLVLVGDGNYKQRLKEKIKELNIENSITFTGVQNNISHLLAESAIFVFASRSESFGMSIVEAFDQGLPVICYDCENGPRDLVFSYYNGFLIKENDIESFAKKLSLLIEDEQLRDELGYFAKKYSQRFAVNKVMQMYDDLINSLCKPI